MDESSDASRSLMSPRPAARGDALGWIVRAVSRNALLVVLVLLIVIFSALLPSTFPTAFNFRTLLSEKSVVALLALSVLVPLSANQYDLSVGYLLGIVHILAIGLQVKNGLPWEAAVVLAIAAAVIVGVVNGLLVTRFKVGSFIATLGTGTVTYGIGLWYTGGEQVNGILPPAFLAIASAPFGVPFPAIMTAVVALAMWWLYSYLPLGRYLYVVGDNPAPRNWSAYRCSAIFSCVSSPQRRLRVWRASSLLPNCASVKARWAPNICCRLSPRCSSERRRSTLGA